MIARRTSTPHAESLGLRVERRIGITVTGLALLAVVVVGWLLSRVLQSRSMALLSYGLLLLTVASYLLSRRKPPVEATRADLPVRIREGQRVDVDLRLIARRRVTGLILEDQLPDKLGASPRLPVPLLPGGEELSHSYGFVPQLRGIYTIGPLVAVTGDAFGLTRRRMTLAEPQQIIVHPRTETVHDRVLSREWEDPPVRPPIAKPWPTGFEFYGMRDYELGDDPRRIMWRAAARSWDPTMGVTRYMVRESEQGITDRVTLLLDTEERHHSPGEPSDTFETAVRVVASLGARHIKDGFSVSAFTNTDQIADMVRGSRARLPFLDALAGVQRTKESMQATAQRILASPRAHTHLVVVAPEILDDTARVLRILVDRGASVMVALIRWEESDSGSARRAGAVGCNFVEIPADAPLEKVFSAVLGTGVAK